MLSCNAGRVYIRVLKEDAFSDVILAMMYYVMGGIPYRARSHTVSNQ